MIVFIVYPIGINLFVSNLNTEGDDVFIEPSITLRFCASPGVRSNLVRIEHFQRIRVSYLGFHESFRSLVKRGPYKNKENTFILSFIDDI